MPKAVFSYSFRQLYYLAYIRPKPNFGPELQSLELPALLIAYPALGC